MAAKALKLTAKLIIIVIIFIIMSLVLLYFLKTLCSKNTYVVGIMVNHI